MTCKLCLERGKNWNGSDPRCAFEGERFSAENWNCATMNALRCIAEDEGAGVVRRYYCEGSQSGALVDTYDVDFPGDEDSPHPGFALWLTWYKSRGCTEGCALMGSDNRIVVPTEADCLAIINHYEATPRPKP